ncbi:MULTISPECIES: hypothetical protein [Ralstonia]|uniref:hypothetical protein n=1 Tax=Ralstonia TaxID=48736 RepID=UPI0013A6D97E|nr:MULTISPECIES: hypothetical protein [unclassified Ralstonia]
MEQTQSYTFDIDSASQCNGNSTTDRQYIQWFCGEAVRRSNRAAMQVRDIAKLRDWGSLDSVKARLESSWALLVALRETLDSLASSARNKPEIAAPFLEAVRQVNEQMDELKEAVQLARAWFQSE